MKDKRTRKTILNRLKSVDCKLQAIVDSCGTPDSLFTAFNVSTATGNACLNPDLSPFNQVLYHDGEGEFPVVGDTVYIDPQGTNPFSTEFNAEVQVEGAAYLACAMNGVVVDITCK